MSRIPRNQEHLKTAFTAEAVSAARYRAFAAKALVDGHPNLAQRWLALAVEKDHLAVVLLGAAEQVWGETADLRAAIAEERFENDVLYPKMLAEIEQQQVRGVFETVASAQRKHLGELDALRSELTASTGDVRPPSAEAAPVTAPAAAHS